MLVDEARAAGLRLDAAIADACERHHRLLVRWNKTHNLTRVTEERDAVFRHYLDCLWPALSEEPRACEVIDVGSGAGFPGLIVALAWPQSRFTLVEPAAKRTSFLRVAIAELSLQDRVAVAKPPATGMLVLSRATFARGERAPLAAALAPGGELWLWSASSEKEGWQTEARALGLQALSPLERSLRGEPRVILRAIRGPT